jgi:hypothetical protein
MGLVWNGVSQVLGGFGVGLTMRSRWDSIRAGPPSCSSWPHFCTFHFALGVSALS